MGPFARRGGWEEQIIGPEVLREPAAMLDLPGGLTPIPFNKVL